MKLIFSEFVADYGGYRFPYQVWGMREKKDNLAQIYVNGWLPFRSKKDLFYLSRGTRVRLSKFDLSSENRRILRKTDGLNFSVIPVESFEYTPEVQKFCKVFADEIFGKGMMPVAAIRKIFTNSNGTHVMVFEFNQKVIGYVLVVIHDHFLHYAHPFYNLSLGNKDVGMGMMVRAVQWAKDQTKQFAYLGTCYSKSAMYKTQFAGFEFFNGWRWSDCLKELKFLIDRKSDGYLLMDKEYREKFLEGKVDGVLKNEGMRVSFK